VVYRRLCLFSPSSSTDNSVRSPVLRSICEGGSTVENERCPINPVCLQALASASVVRRPWSIVASASAAVSLSRTNKKADNARVKWHRRLRSIPQNGRSTRERSTGLIPVTVQKMLSPGPAFVPAGDIRLRQVLPFIHRFGSAILCRVLMKTCASTLAR
jgi:hypothetical protein